MKNIITVFVLFSFISLLSPLSRAQQFSDIRSGSKLEEYLLELQQKEIVQGYPDGTIRPNDPLNRAEALKMVMLSLKMNTEEATEDPFSDVKISDWYGPFIAQAKTKGIISGYPDGSFRAEQYVNRAEFIKMSTTGLNISTSSSPKALQQFTDLDADEWYIPFINAALDLNLLTNTKLFRPTDFITRGEAIEIIYKLNNFIEQHEEVLDQDQQTFIPSDQIAIREEESFGDASLPAPAYSFQRVIIEHMLGASIRLKNADELIASEWVDNQLSLEFHDGCFVDFFRYPPTTLDIQAFFEQNLNAVDTAIVPAKSSSIALLSHEDGYDLYQITTEWDLEEKDLEESGLDPISTDILINKGNINTLLIPHGVGKKASECFHRREEVLNGFKILSS